MTSTEKVDFAGCLFAAWGPYNNGGRELTESERQTYRNVLAAWGPDVVERAVTTLIRTCYVRPSPYAVFEECAHVWLRETSKRKDAP